MDRKFVATIVRAASGLAPQVLTRFFRLKSHWMDFSNTGVYNLTQSCKSILFKNRNNFIEQNAYKSQPRTEVLTRGKATSDTRTLDKEKLSVDINELRVMATV